MTSRLTAFLLLALAAVTPFPGNTAETIRAVVVGIDDYSRPDWNLDGAVADAHDIAFVLAERGVKVTLLTNGEATRERVTEALKATIAQSEPGDVIVFSFAGHGVQLKEALPGDEADARDEFFLFAPSGKEGADAKDGPSLKTGPETAKDQAATKNMRLADVMRDNDFSVIIDSVPPDVGFVIVVDACHSGTMTRSPLAFGSDGKVRTRELAEADWADLPPPPASTYHSEDQLNDNVVYISGASDEQSVAEIKIGGRSRGALSFAIARALEGRADGGDGRTTMADLRSFIETTVRQFADERQTPTMRFAEDAATRGGLSGPAILRLFNTTDDRRPDAKVNGGVGTERPALAGGDGTVATDYEDWLPIGTDATGQSVVLPASPRVFEVDPATKTVSPTDAAEIVWSPGTRDLIDRSTGDLLARPKDDKELASALLKWRVVQALKFWTIGRPAEVTVVEGDGRHKLGTSISIDVLPPSSAPDLRYLTLINLAGNGLVQYVFPAPGHEAGNRDVISRDAPYRAGPIPVIEPVGSDMVIAVLTAERPTELRTALRALHGQIAPVELLTTLVRHSDSAAVQRVALKQIFTDN